MNEKPVLLSQDVATWHEWKAFRDRLGLPQRMTRLVLEFDWELNTPVIAQQTFMVQDHREPIQ